MAGDAGITTKTESLLTAVKTHGGFFFGMLIMYTAHLMHVSSFGGGAGVARSAVFLRS